MEFKEIQVEILRGSCNFPSGSIHLSDGSLEKVWHSVACQPDFPEFFTRNIREAGGNEDLPGYTPFYGWMQGIPGNR